VSQGVEEHLAGERVAVGVQALGRQPQQQVSLLHPAGQGPVLLHHADDEAGHVVVVFGVGARHLRRLAADQRAGELGAGPGEAADDLLDPQRVHPPQRDVVEEEKRQRPLHQDVVDAVGDQIVADGVVDAGGDRHLDLGADAVGGGDQHRVAVAREVGTEHAAEGADLGEHSGVEGAAGERLDAVLRRVRRSDVDTRLAVVHEKGESIPKPAGRAAAAPAPTGVKMPPRTVVTARR